jgi:uncharacterized Zn finger protein
MPRFGDDFRRDDFSAWSGPREAKGGIRAANKRGRFGESWWAQRWIAVLESFNIGGRLARGRNYARRGQVLSIDIGKGCVEARVQGSRPAPYAVSIKVRPLSPAEWKRLAGQLSTQAIFLAKLLAGEMPRDIETAFRGAGLSLFPEKATELSTECSCPDWSNPCKHVAAVYYLLGEDFDRDPFLIFRLRGVDRGEFLEMLGQSKPSAAVADEPPPAAEPLSATDFWTAKELPPDSLGDVTTRRPTAALPRRLGNLRFWRGEVPLLDALEAAYERAADAGQQIVSERSL